jgi:hypothetical protein
MVEIAETHLWHIMKIYSHYGINDLSFVSVTKGP